MKVLEFLNRLDSKLHHKPIRIIKTSGPSPYATLQRLKGIFYHIDFGCKIGKDGSDCKYFQGRLSKDEPPMCCCDQCFDRVGYLDVLTNQPTYFARLFNRKTGFWRKDKGCILPREHRSITCLTHHCNHTWMSSYKPTPGIPANSFGDGMGEIKQHLINLEYEASIKSLMVKFKKDTYEIVSQS